MSTSISDYFTGIAAKRLSSVEINSNQHEFNGINDFRYILGRERKSFEGRFIYLPDNEEQIIDNKGTLTWYDVRANNPNRSAEFRLYFSDSEIVPNASIGDLVIMCKDLTDAIVIIVSPKDSTSEKQLLWLFGLEELENKFVVKDFSEDKQALSFAGKYILETFGIKIDEIDENYLDQMIDLFGLNFPTTKEFSEFTRSTVKDVSPVEDPDGTLIAWWEKEGILLRTFEAQIIKERLAEGFGEDGLNVDEFLSFSMSVINRRKSRAGHSFENHLEVIFNANELSFTKGGKTERNSRPDFIFPSILSYHNPEYNPNGLTMLGVKTTLKDRWRQVLAEAERIKNKHLITLEPAISWNQTQEIIANNLQLVIPQPLMETFLPQQRERLINLGAFIKQVLIKQ